MKRPLLHGLAAALVLTALSACAHGGAKRAEARARRAAALGDWRQVATPADRERIRTWRDGWTQAIAKIGAAGESRRLIQQGVLMKPDAALGDPAPPPGDYLCRTFKLGATRAGTAPMMAFPAVPCRISGGSPALGFAVSAGAQRPIGMFYRGDDSRLIFLGTMMLGDETRAMAYGRDPERDMAGALERVGPRRWRLVLPFPHWESTLDVIEIAPKG